MKKKQFEYGMMGLFIGLVLGALIGLGELNWIKKSQRATMAIPIIAVTAVICCGIGYNMGNKHGRLVYIKQKTGLDNINTEYYKDGRYWIGKSTWKDNRGIGVEMKVVTKRENGILCSSINGQIFLSHGIPNASQQTVPRHHKEVISNVSQKIIDGYVEGREQILQL